VAYAFLLTAHVTMNCLVTVCARARYICTVRYGVLSTCRPILVFWKSCRNTFDTSTSTCPSSTMLRAIISQAYYVGILLGRTLVITSVYRWEHRQVASCITHYTDHIMILTATKVALALRKLKGRIAGIVSDFDARYEEASPAAATGLRRPSSHSSFCSTCRKE
jgi:hypothetical protein